MKDSDITKALDILFSSDIGFSVGVCGQLYIREVSDGYAVGTEYSELEIQKLNKQNWETTYENKASAIAKFIEERTSGKIGDDFWRE